jgi:hypothetical protein
MARDKVLVKKNQYIVHLFLFINTALYIMHLMRANPLLGQGGEVWAMEILTFLGPKCHLPDCSMPFHRAKKVSISRAQPPPAFHHNGFACIKSITNGPYKS